jgi:hypothetical protein
MPSISWVAGYLQRRRRGKSPKQKMTSTLTDAILTDKQLSNSAYTHAIQAPIENVDIAAWLLKLPEAEHDVD